MTPEEVRAKLGRPAMAKTDDEGNTLWYYLERSENLDPGFQLGGLNILFQHGRVTKVQPVMVQTQRH